MMVLDRDGTFIQDVLADVHHTPSAIAADAQAVEQQRGLVLRIKKFWILDFGFWIGNDLCSIQGDEARS